jgi:hypothetical protein
MISLKEALLIEAPEEEQDLPDIDSIDGLALMIDSGRHSSDYILYSPRYYATKMKEEVSNAQADFRSIRFKTDKFDKFKDYYAFSNVQDVFNDPKGIYGYASVNNGRVLGLVGSCNRANEIRRISAQDGYGKILFKIILEKESPIMSNRDTVSQDSYDQFSNLNKDFRVDKDPFENERSLRKKTTNDCDVYNDTITDQSYKAEESRNSIARILTDRHKLFLEQMKNFFKRSQVDYIQSRVKEYVADAGFFFFKEGHGSPGWYENADEIE